MREFRLRMRTRHVYTQHTVDEQAHEKDALCAREIVRFRISCRHINLIVARRPTWGSRAGSLLLHIHTNHGAGEKTKKTKFLFSFDFERTSL